MTEEEKWVKRLPRWTYESAVSQFKPVAPMLPNTLTNSDGTPYSAGYDEKQAETKALNPRLLDFIRQNKERLQAFVRDWNWFLEEVEPLLDVSMNDGWFLSLSQECYVRDSASRDNNILSQ